MTARTRVGVLVSGAGTNLAALLKACAGTAFPAEVVCVVSNRPGAGALDIAKAWRVPYRVMPQRDFGNDSGARDHAMLDYLREMRVQLIVCAGYERILSDEFLSAFPDAILNVHPSLLPAFGGGMHGVEDALAHGVKVTGCTVQLLEHGEPDGGPIVLQAAVPVLAGDTPATLRMRIHQQEWRLLPHAVRLWSEGRLRRNGRVVEVVEAGPAAAESEPSIDEVGDAAGGSPPARKEGPHGDALMAARETWGARERRSGGVPAAAGPASAE